MNKPFNTWHKSRYWKTVITDDSEFEKFRLGFPTVVYNNYRSRPGQSQKKKRQRNDLFHFCAGPYQPDEAMYYIRHPDFIKNHFNAQVFQFQKSQSQTIGERVQDAVKDILTLNALSSNPIFPKEPSNYLEHYYSNWHSKSLQLVRFKVPSRHYGRTYTVFIVYSSRKETKLEEILNENPDNFFLNRIIDYMCTCQVGLRTLGSCVHVGE